MTDPDLLKAITEGPLENRRRAIRILASYDLTPLAYSTLGASYVYSVSKGDRPSTVRVNTMQSAVKMLGLVLEEILCGSILDPLYLQKFTDLMERVDKISIEKHSPSRLRVYIKTSLRLLAVFGVLKESTPLYTPYSCVPYVVDEPNNAIRIFQVSLNNWMTKNLIEQNFKEVSQDEVEMVLATIPPPLYKLLTGETLAPPKPAPLIIEEQASDDQGPTEVESITTDDVDHGFRGDLKQSILHVYNEHNKLARSLKHQRVFYTDKQNHMIEKLKGISEINEQLLKLSRQFEALCAALQWKPPA